VLSVSSVWLMVIGSSISSSSHPPAVTVAAFKLPAAAPRLPAAETLVPAAAPELPAAALELPAAAGPDKPPLLVLPMQRGKNIHLVINRFADILHNGPDMDF